MRGAEEVQEDENTATELPVDQVNTPIGLCCYISDITVWHNAAMEDKNIINLHLSLISFNRGWQRWWRTKKSTTQTIPRTARSR